MVRLPHLVLLILAWSTFFSTVLSADQYQLRRVTDGNQQWQQVQLKLDVHGQVLMKDSGGKENRQEVSVEGYLAYEEATALEVKEQGEDQLVTSVRAVRLYQSPRVLMMVGQSRLVPRLRESRRMILMSSRDGNVSLTSLQGALTREELDLVRNQGDSALLPLLLPVEPLEIGDKWFIPRQLVRALLTLDQVDESTIQGRLADVDESIAQVTIAGRVRGRVESAATEITVQGRLHVNLRLQRVERLELEIKEKRAIGRAEPGLDVTATLSMTCRPLQRAFQLPADLLVRSAGRPTASDALLEFQSRHADYQLLHDPRWHVTSDRPLVLMRYIEQGKLLAQCNIARLPTQSESPATLEQFQQQVQRSLGDSLRGLVEASEETTASKMRVMRVVATGVSAQLPVQWIYYHIQDSQGRRVAMSFSVPATTTEEFGQADRILVATLGFDSERTRQREGTPVRAGSSNSSKPLKSRIP
jgi:hypothetical protein